MTHGEAYAVWYRGLDSAKKDAIRRLHRINPWWNLMAIAFAVSWFLTALLMIRYPSWLVRLPGYVVIGILLHGMANFMHEGIHNTLFKDKRWNRWFGFVMGAPVLFSVTTYGVNHLLHHRYNRTERDPDEFKNVTQDPRLLSIFYYVWIVLGMVFYALRLPYSVKAHGSSRQRTQAAVENGLLLIVLGSGLYSAWRFGWLPELIHVWLIPLAVAALLSNVRGWAEHTLTVPGHPLTETRTVVSSRLFSFLNINLNYHLEHHLFPGVPWYNLPKVHRILIEDYRSAGASIYRSYPRFLYDAFRLGVHGFT